MFTIDYDDTSSNATLRIYPRGQSADPDDSGTHVANREDLATLIQAKPGEWSVTLWNHLPGVTPINTPKFRNRSTAIDRIWGKLCELYPDAVPSEEMPTQAQTQPPRSTHRKQPAKLFKASKRKQGQPSKRDSVVKLLKRKSGATVEDLCKQTGWKPNAVNGILQWISWVTAQGLKRFDSHVSNSGKRTYRAA